MSNTNTPRFTIWREYSPVFDVTRYNVYDDGHHCQGFDIEAQALEYVKQLEAINPQAPKEIRTYGDYRIVKYFSYTFIKYRYRTENRTRMPLSGLSYWDLDQLFDTLEQAVEYCTIMDARDDARFSHDIEQVYP